MIISVPHGLASSQSPNRATESSESKDDSLRESVCEWETESDSECVGREEGVCGGGKRESMRDVCVCVRDLQEDCAIIHVKKLSFSSDKCWMLHC